MESGLALYLLGPPRIECDGVAVKVDRRKAMALLVYLAVTGERQRRDTLVNLLWPESDTARGRTALRGTLYVLRKAVGGAWLDVDREEIGLNPGAGLWVDVDQFRQYLAECESHGHPASQVCPACVAPLTEAVALVRGDFLSGFGLKDSFNFDDWQLLEAEALRRELGEALDRLVHACSAGRDFEAAWVHAKRRLALDPLDEGAHRGLMRLHAWSGQRPAALRQYEACVALLEDQLGVPPQEATTELYQAIRAGRVPPLPGESWEGEDLLPAARSLDLAPQAPPFLEEGEPVERPVFVAREGELGKLEGHLDAALAGQGRVVFVTGEAGSGKTALVQEFMRCAQERHADLIVAGGNCNAHTGIGDPYLPFREVLQLLTGDVQARWAAGAISREQARRLWDTLPLAARAVVEAGPDLIETFVPGTALVERAAACMPGGANWLTRLDELVRHRAAGPAVQSPRQSHLLEQYTQVLWALAGKKSLLLALDDLQWADGGSVNLLFHLGRRIGGSRILIVGAYRPAEVALGRAGARHPLEPIVNEFKRTFGDIAVDLEQAEGRQLVDAFLDSEPNRLSDVFRDMLHEQTQGHPLFTVELWRGMQEQGALVQDPKGWWVEGPALDWETLPARVEAVIGERIGRLAERLRATLRVASVEGEVFTAEVVARVRSANESEVVGRLSRELDRRHRLVQAQGIQRLEGRRLSRFRFRHILFQRYLYNSLDEVERVHLHEAVGNMLETLYGGQAEAPATTAATEAIAGQLAWHFQEAGLAEKAAGYLRQAGERAMRLSAHKEAIAHLERGLELLAALPDPAAEGGQGTPDVRSERARQELARQELALQLALGMAWIAEGTVVPEVEKAFTRARELGEQTGQVSQLCQVLGELAVLYYVGTEYGKARESAEEALSLAQGTGEPLLVAHAHWILGFVLFGIGEFKAALAHLQQMISFYKAQQHHRLLLFYRRSDAGLSALAYAACCLWCLGYPEQAMQRSQEVIALARELGHAFSLADALSYAACLLNALRRDARALKDSTEELVRVSSEGGFRGWHSFGMCFRGEALAMLGQVEEGMAQMREGLAARGSQGMRCYEAGTLCTLAGAQAEAGHPEEGLATLDQALARVEETGEHFWEAELHRVRAELLLMEGDEAGAEASLLKAVEVAHCQSARSWELRATTDLARLWQAQGREEEARQALAGIYGWFSEGFETRDLKEAEALLGELSPPQT